MNNESSSQDNNQAEEFETNTNPPLTPQAETSAPKPKRKLPKKFIYIAVAIVVLIASLTVFLLLKSKSKNAEINDSSSSAKTSQNSSLKNSTDSATSQPFAFTYAYTVQPKTTASNGCGTSQSTVFWRPISGGDRTQALTLSQNDYITSSGVYKNKVFVATVPSCSSTEGATVWYSSDSGKTYSKVFSGKAAKDNTTLGEQITSAMFSSDGKTILVAFLGIDATKNTIKEIDPAAKTTKDVFTADGRGVFIEGYNNSSKQIYYYEGCYNCDGNNFGKLLAHDIAKNTNSVIFESAKSKGGNATYANSGVTKLLLIQGTLQDGAMGLGKPFTIQELDTSNNTVKTLKTIDNDTASGYGGYREGDDTPYYIDGNTIYTLDNSGKASVAYESSKKIYQVPFYSKDTIAVASGDYENYDLSTYSFVTKASTHILNGDNFTNIFGVSWK